MINIDIADTVSVASVLDVVDVCGNLPPLAKTKFRALELSYLHQKTPLERIPESTFIKLWQLIGEFHPCPNIGLVIGQRITPKSKGVLASWVSQSDTIGEALNTFQKNIILMNPSERWTISDDGINSTLTLTVDPQKKYPILAIERSMSAMVSWARMLSAHSFPIKSAEFTFSQPKYRDHYDAVFGSELTFKSEENRLTFKTDFLQLPIASSNQYVKEVMAETAEKALKILNNTRDIKTLVTEIIIESVSKSNLIGIDIVASKLHISRQTLYRKLEKENTTYKAIVEDIRKQQVIASLSKSKPPSITELSYNLGFKDTSSFYKAFKRWFDTTPKEYLSRN